MEMKYARQYSRETEVFGIREPITGRRIGSRYRRWWVWAIALIVVLAGFSFLGVGGRGGWWASLGRDVRNGPSTETVKVGPGGPPAATRGADTGATETQSGDDDQGPTPGSHADRVPAHQSAKTPR